MGKTFIYSTDDPAKTGWDRVVIDEAFHDMSFLFWEDRAFLLYDNGDIKIVELEPDLSGVKKDGLRKLLAMAVTDETELDLWTSSVWAQVSVYALADATWHKSFRPKGVKDAEWAGKVRDFVCGLVFAKLKYKSVSR